ncbi:MAG: alkaline phosphatase [Tannerella sp.]|jgi:alkaline phosphatase|nr:alkaline phosphatase [Tannerella sp.]
MKTGKKTNRIALFIGLLFLSVRFVSAQTVKIHSHNDYRQTVPFYQAYAQQAASVEADIFATDKDGELLVAHDRHELPEAPTIDETYIQPLVKLYKQNKGRAWKNADRLLILLVDLKTPANPALDRLISKLQQYPDVFDPAVNPYAVRVVISGNRPDPDMFASYPSIISFDGSKTDYTAAQLERISMISLNLRDYTRWNGKGRMKSDEFENVKAAVDAVHALNKPIRFWGTPDGVTAWNTFHHIGIDYINTDQPEACAAFFNDFHKKTFRINAQNEEIDDIAKARRLDKSTVDFEGFQSKKLQLTRKVETYQPAYQSDGTDKPVKNVIFMIGDGMGLAQICVADAINEGLSLLKLKQIGLQQTQAEDAYTTDSAAAGSALATGQKHRNRHISSKPSGEPYPSLTDVFYDKGYACGVVTLGNVADATPAAFYGHTTERDNSDEITDWLLQGKLTLLTGSGYDIFTTRADGKNLLTELESKANYTIQTTVDDMNKQKGKVICLDERMEKAATEETIHLLAKATGEALKKLTDENNTGFFLMVEGAKIDYAGHANSLPGSVLETLSFDLAVAEALKFADHNNETLVIVTGDHETGGLSLVDGDLESGAMVAQYMTDDHTPIMLPVFTYGPRSGEFTGVYRNTGIFQRILKVIGLNINKE